LTIGGIVLGQSILTPQAQAAATVGTFPMSGWFTDLSSGALATSRPMIPLDDQILAGSSNSASTSTSGQTTTGGWIGTYSTTGTPPTSGKATIIVNGNGSTNLTTGAGIGNEFSTLALDANMNGHGSSPYMYFWSWQGDMENTPATLSALSAVMGQTRPSDYIQPIFRLAPGQTQPEVSAVPTARYFADSAQAPLLETVWSGGEVIQRTGQVFFSGAECDNLDGAYRMMIWDPTTGAYNYSGQIVAASTDDDIFGGALVAPYGCGGEGTVASDMALDANGNAYILVESDQAVPSMGITTTLMRMWLVRVVPSTTGNWTYNLVTPLTAAPNEPVGSQAQAFAGTSTLPAYQTGTYGMAFYQGTLYATNTMVNTLMAINPMSGYVNSIPAGNLVGTFGDPTFVYDLASGQTAYTIDGGVFDDANMNGVQDTGESVLGGETVALYMKNQTTGKYVLEGTRVTDPIGQYSFLVGGQGDYIVRLVRPTINGVNAVQTAASGGGSLNPVVAQCGSTTVSSAAGGKCSGAIPMPTPDPTVPTDPMAMGSDTTTQPDTMAIYTTVTITSSEEVATANFGVAASASFGDSPAGPATVAAGAPIHNNGENPQIWLGSTLGSYAAPATNDSHTTSDDGVFIKSWAGQLPLGTASVLSGTYSYDLVADVSGPQANTGYVNAWTTGVNNLTWGSTPVWSPAIANGVAERPFQFATSGSWSTGQPVKMRVDASTVNQTSPTNLGGTYQALANNGTQNWATPGEIEDYSLTVADAVYRPAVKTNGATGSFSVAGESLAGSSTLNVGSSLGAATGVAVLMQAVAPDSTWGVSGITITDTTTGTIIATPSFTTSGATTSFSYTPTVGSDVIIEVDYMHNPDAAASTLTLSPNPTGAGQNMTATATINDSAGTPLDGVPVAFAVTDSNLSLSAQTCTTSGAAGTCSVTVTSNTAGTYTNSLTAKVDINGTATNISGSPASPQFTAGVLDPSKSSFTVTPQANTADSSTWVVVSTGSSYYTGTLVAKDSNGNLINSLTTSDIVFAASSAHVVITSVVNNHDGTYTVHYSSTLADSTPTTTLVYQGTQIGTALPIPFQAGPPVPGPIVCPDPSQQGSTLEVATDLTVTTNETAVGDPVYATAHVTDQFCNPVGNAVVTFTIDPGTQAILAPPSVPTGSDGNSTTSLNDNTAESVTLRAFLGTQSIDGSPQVVKFDASAFSFTLSTFTVTPVANLSDPSTWVTVSTGSPAYLGVLTARDSSGNVLTNLALDQIAFTASTSNVSVTSVVNNGDGTYSVHFSSTVADPATTARVTYQTTPVGTAKAIPFAADVPDPGPVVCPPNSKYTVGTNVSASPSELAVGDTSTVTALITDKYCNPLPGVAVTFTEGTPTSGVLTTVINPTNSDGIATASLTDPTAETVNVTAKIAAGTVYGSPVPVKFDTGLISFTNSTFTVTPVANPADTSTWVVVSTGSTYYTGILTAKDGSGNLLTNLTLSDIAFATSSTHVTITSVVNNGDGTYSVKFSSTLADATPTATVAYQGTQIGTALPIPFFPGPPVPGPIVCPDVSQQGTTLEVATSLTATTNETSIGDPVYLTAHITDQYCNPVDKAPVTFSLDPGTSAILQPTSMNTGPDGNAVATLTDTTAESVVAHAALSGSELYGSPQTILFDNTVFSFTNSSFTVTPVANTSDSSTWVGVSTGTPSYVGTLTAKDGAGTLMKNLLLNQIAFAASSPFVTVSAVTNNGDGTYTVQYSSTVADPATTASVTYQTTQVGTDLPIPFKADSPDPGPVVCPAGSKYTQGTNVSASPSELAVSDTSTVTALITDKFCNPLPGVTVTFTEATPTSGVLTTVINPTGADGIATASLTDATAETVNVTATIPAGTVYGSPVPVTFTSGLFSYTNSTFTVTPTANTADSSTWVAASTGSSYYTGTLTAKDGSNNLLKSLTTSDIAFAASSTNVKVTSVVNNGDGTYTVQYSSTAADATPTATVAYKGTQVGATLPIPFKAGSPVPGPVVCPAGSVNLQGTNLSAAPSSLPVGDLSTVTAHITDAFCNPVANTVVTFSLGTGTSALLTPTSQTTGADGNAIATLSDTAPDTVAVHAALGTQEINGSPASVTFTSTAPPAPVITSPAPNTDTNTATPTFSGTGTTPGDTITVKDENGNTVCTTQVTSTKTWTCAPLSPGLADGTHTLRATETDTAGDVSQPSAPLTLGVDTVPPQKPTITLANETAIAGTVPGPNDPGTVVTITYPKADGTTGTTTAPVNTTTGAWNAPTPPDAVSGPITAVATDPAGNNSPTATGTLDTVPPDEPIVREANKTDIAGSVPGTNDPGTDVTITYPRGNGTTGTVTAPVDTTTGDWTAPTPSDAVSGPITVVATDPAGNDSPPANGTLDTTVPQSPTVTQANKTAVKGTVPGTNEPGTTVTVTWPDGSTTANVPLNSDGTWSVPTPAGMPSGPITAKAINPAGNSSTPTTAQLDTSTPQSPTVTQANKTAVKGTVPGTNEPGTTVTVTWPDGSTTANVPLNSDGTWSVPTPAGMPSGPITAQAINPAGNPSTPTTAQLDTSVPQSPTVTQANKTAVKGTVPGTNEPGTTVTVTWPDGSSTADVPLNSDGTWSVPTPAGMPSGPITVLATNPAGNPSAPTTAQLDTSVPQDPTVTQANKAAVKGTVPGSNEPGTTVTIQWPDGSQTTGVPVNSDGTWTVPTPAGMPSGDIKVTAVNAAGNDSNTITKHLDTTTPSSPTVNPTNGTQIDGTGDAGATVTVTDENNNPIPGCEDVIIQPDGSFDCKPTTSLDPGTIVNVTEISQSGNPSDPTTLTVQALAIEVMYPSRNPLQTQIVTGYNFNPQEQVCLTMQSDSINCGCAPADDNGTVSIQFTIPSGVALGDHQVTMTGAVSGSVMTMFTVTASPSISTGGVVESHQGFPYGLLFAGSIMVVAGLWITATDRRHRKENVFSTR